MALLPLILGIAIGHVIFVWAMRRSRAEGVSGRRWQLVGLMMFEAVLAVAVWLQGTWQLLFVLALHAGMLVYMTWFAPPRPRV